MKFGKVTPERNTNPSITINVKTRSPMEAYQMLRQGHPIDQMAGYFDEQGLIPQDFWMLDKTAKLHKLAELRVVTQNLENRVHQYQEEIKQQQQKYETEKQKSESATQNSAPPKQEKSEG